MPRRPDMPCAVCGQLMWRGKGALPAGQATCRRCRAAARQRICEQCGEQFEADRKSSRFCSLACVGEYQAAERGRWSECVVCGESFRQRAFRIKTCSRACGRVLGTQTSRVARGAPGPSSKVYFPTCTECGVLFAAHRRVNVCSAECRRIRNARVAMDAYRSDPRVALKAAHARRARLVSAMDERVDPVTVFERDGWRCHICGKRVRRVPRMKRDPEMASLDHLVPLIEGGRHSYANTACSHYRCNLKKGASGGNEQLAFI